MKSRAWYGTDNIQGVKVARVKDKIRLTLSHGHGGTLQRVTVSVPFDEADWLAAEIGALLDD